MKGRRDACLHASHRLLIRLRGDTQPGCLTTDTNQGEGHEPRRRIVAVQK